MEYTFTFVENQKKIHNRGKLPAINLSKTLAIVTLVI